MSDVDVVSWHPNGHYLVTGSSDHTVRLWDLQTGQAQRVLVGHRSAVSPSGLLLRLPLQLLIIKSAIDILHLE